MTRPSAGALVAALASIAGSAHTRERALLMRLLSPLRLKQNESFMWRLADEQLAEFVDAGRCEFISAYAQPFAMLVIADLLGVPEAECLIADKRFSLVA